MIASQNVLKMKLKFPKVDFVNVFENDFVCFVNECKCWTGSIKKPAYANNQSLCPQSIRTCKTLQLASKINL